MIYLDSAATTPIRRKVLETMWPYLTEEFGNASSHHDKGEAARRALDEARATVAKALGARSSDIVFTSGGTESDNLAIKGIALAKPRGRHIVTSEIEHPAVLESCDYLQRHHGFRITYLPVDGCGVVDASDVEAALSEHTTLVSVMYANNEVGTVQDISGIAEVTGRFRVPLHTDAVQAMGALDCNVAKLGVDALSISGHKLGAPKGVGALYVRGRFPLEAIVHGGGQEFGRRSGTENVAGAVGLAAALSLRPSVEESTQLARRAESFIAKVLSDVPNAVLTGHRTRRLPGIASFCFPGTSGESVLLQLEESGITCSSGSACAAGNDAPSPVLTAMGISAEIAQTAVRFSFGVETGEDELISVAESVVGAVASVRGLATR
ncbi:cysteine desulfurase family protein [Saxibacter everestensis]|uniref:cysteine desulfurase n=1 Tax=Saxibacter everestensis TaxID=2909229 RepID=A0ABY8QNH7_9MICO|nr:cysteine desulfurase family protein [Brevibacteriaceae bacterium ZFBP1038]